jgi:excisionase family DNA binding protein
MTQHEVLTPQQAADILQLPKRTVLDLCRRGTLGAKKLGRRWRIPRASLDKVFDGPSVPAQP